MQTADFKGGGGEGGKEQTEGKMQTEDCRPGVKCWFSSKTNHLPRKASRVSWDRGHISFERLAIMVMAIDVLNLTSSDGFGVDILF